MNRPELERVTDYARDHPVRSVFVLLAALPTVLAVFSFRQPLALPDAVLSELELLFRLLVYVPVGISRSLLFDPLGLSVLFTIPGLQQTTIVLTLLGFYYLVSHALVRVGTLLVERMPATAL